MPSVSLFDKNSSCRTGSCEGFDETPVTPAEHIRKERQVKVKIPEIDGGF
jgi:hypothetical protein